MKPPTLFLVSVFFTFYKSGATAATLFVSLNGTNPIPPYADWSTAATNIQNAIDAASAGDTVVVSNGIYSSGGRVAEGALTNRVAVDKPIVVQSVNGPAVTIIQGYAVPGTMYGTNAVRCVYLTNGATLEGFTLTNGSTEDYLVSLSSLDSSGGGIYCDSTNAQVMNCIIVSNAASASCGANSGTLMNCIVAGNRGGSAVYAAVLYHCTVTNNSGYGGINTCTANNCVIANNSGQNGGGAVYGVLNHCYLSGNYASAYGGGAYNSTLTGCVLVNNQAGWGGGAISSTLNNCLVVSNAAYSQQNTADTESLGGGTWGGTANNCTIVGNVAKRPNSMYGGLSWMGGGAFGGSLNNCILYGNSESPGRADNYYNYYPGTLSNCCTTPQPSSGAGNFTFDPILANPNGGDFHLQTDSPCVNAGNNAYVGDATDLDGNPRIVGGTVDIGAYEYPNPTSLLSYAWLQQYGLPTDGSADFIDSDHDGMNNWQEWRAGTSPLDPSSLLEMLSLSNNVSGTTLTWRSTPGVLYYLQSTTNPVASPFSSVASNLVGQADTSSFTDTSATNAPELFYRVGVQ
jgi:hypothetical protein